MLCLKSKKFLNVLYFCFFYSQIIQANPMVVANRIRLAESSDKICCLGWKEWVRLPNLFKDRILAKIDSGAKTSSLHAKNISIFEKGNEEWVRFTVYPKRDSQSKKYQVEAKVIEIRQVRSSNGETSNRPVIMTRVSIGGQSWPIEITLINREKMSYRMLLGRSAFNKKFLIDTGRSFILSEKQRKKKENGKEETKTSTGRLLAYYDSIQGSLLGNIFSTILAILCIFLGRLYILRILAKKKTRSSAGLKKLRAYSRNLAFLIGIASLLIIWSNEFKTVSIYLMAISMAVVLFMRELIKNFHGGFMLLGSRAFKIGDIIKVKDMRGEVVDTSLMTTKISEVVYGGSSCSNDNSHLTTLPNSIFLSNPLINESHKKGYVMHSFTYTCKESKQWHKIEEILLNLAKDISTKYLKQAHENGHKVDETQCLENLKVSFSFPSAEKVSMTINVFILAEDQSCVSSYLAREVLKQTQEIKKESTNGKPHKTK